MNLFFRIIIKCFLILSICLILISCSRLTQENFEKIKPGMSMKEVIVILGEPNKVNSFNIAGISATSAIWEGNSAEIVIQFVNDQVTIKSFNKNEGQKKSDEK